jgi:hypothetical protein
MRLAGHITPPRKKRNVYKILVKKLKERETYEYGEITVFKFGLKEIGCGYIQQLVLENMVMNL